jgi:hypothetical protein
MTFLKLLVKASDGIKKFPSSIVCYEGLEIKMNKGNTGSVLVGQGNGDNAFPLDQSESMFLPCKNIDEFVFQTAEAVDQTIHGIAI